MPGDSEKHVIGRNATEADFESLTKLDGELVELVRTNRTWSELIAERWTLVRHAPSFGLASSTT